MQTLVDFWDSINGVRPVVALIASVIFATCGWLYVARRQRVVMRKQHTFNAILQATFDKTYQNSLDEWRPYLRVGKWPRNLEKKGKESLRDSLRFLLNHYEFLAAGIRNGDIDEQLLKDSERGGIVKLFELAENCDYVKTVRNLRERRSIFEHLEWLYERWEEAPRLGGKPFSKRCAVALYTISRANMPF